MTMPTAWLRREPSGRTRLVHAVRVIGIRVKANYVALRIVAIAVEACVTAAPRVNRS